MDGNIIKRLIAGQLTISTMESCTGGMLGSAITDVSGASEIYPGGFITYGNAAKVRCGVPAEVIDTYGVYSAETALAMAAACSATYGTAIGIGVTGSLGRRDPSNPDSVPGEVYFAITIRGEGQATRLTLPDTLATRHDMKAYVVDRILEMLSERL